MAVQPRSRLAVRSALVFGAWITLSALAAAQPAATSPPDGSARDPHDGQTGHGGQTSPADALPEYPSLRFSGFGNLDFSAQSRSEGTRGFSEGQFVLHLASALSPRVNFFGELSFSPRTDAGAGNPPATGFNAEVERAIIRLDHSDRFKVSFGRYHTPINWWNTAFHHGQWLQTTITRPEMTQFGGRFIPVHFVGALVEGSMPAHGMNLTYQAGIGNGRGNVISRGGDAGDNNARPAYVANVFAKPDRMFGLQLGGSFYVDRITMTGQPEVSERIAAAHIVWQREDPELIAEIANVQHQGIGGGATASSLAYYVQTAYRLPGRAHRLKPYYRFDHIGVDGTDVVFSDLPELDGSTFGIRYDVSTYAALKTEGRVRRRAAGEPRTNGWFVQICFTF
jgi:hypothetical protein